MKPHFHLIFNAVLATMGLGTAVAQENMLPVSRTAGIMSVSLPINKVALLAVPLPDIVASGTITSVSGTTLGVSATLGALTGPHAIKITSRDDQRGTGSNAPAGSSSNAYGKSSSIASSTASSVVTTTVLTPNVGDEFIIYKLRTLSDVFGVGGSLVAGWNSAAGPATADIVYIDNGAGALIGYFHKSAGPGGFPHWRLSSAPTGADQDSTPIPAGRAVMVRRRNAGSASTLLFTGVATIGLESPSVTTGYSVLNNPFTVATTLAASGLQSHITTAGSASSADQVFLEDAGVLTGYFFNSSASQWRLVSGGSSDQGSVLLAAGKAILFKEQAGSAGFALPEPFAE